MAPVTRIGRQGGVWPWAARGFTLLEIMVVLVIIGIFAGVLVASLGPPADDALKRERQRVVMVMGRLRFDAMLAGTATALETSDRSWRALVFDPVKLRWQASENTHARELPDDISLTVTTQNSYAAAQLSLPAGGERIYFFGSGENTPFELHLKDVAGADIALYSDGFNLSTEVPQ